MTPNLSTLRTNLERMRVPCDQNPEACMGRMHKDGSHQDPRAVKSLEVLRSAEIGCEDMQYARVTAWAEERRDWLITGALVEVARVVQLERTVGAVAMTGILRQLLDGEPEPLLTALEQATAPKA